MNNYLRLIIFISLTMLSLPLVARTYQYCIPVSKIDFNPYREIKDGKELAYLLLLRPYISNKGEDKSILAAYEFSPDGRIFTAKIRQDALWSDGKIITSEEAALGIAHGFLFRPIGERVKVFGASKSKLQSIPIGVKIIDSSTFELLFDSSIENLTGVVREALTAGSRHNRVWPIRLDSKNKEVLFKNKIKFLKEDKISLVASGKEISLTPSSSCSTNDFSIYSELISPNTDIYNKKINNKPQAITLQLNISSLDLNTRKALSAWMRNVFGSLLDTSGIVGVNSFFLEGEPGYKDVSIWNERQNLQILKALKLELGVEIPIFKTLLEEAAKRDGLSIKFYNFPLQNGKVNGQVLSSGIHEGRQIILQDILNWNYSLAFLNGSPKTIKSLREIARLSASTMPPDSRTLQEFELAARREYSLIPLARRYVTAYSKKELGVELIWNDSGELVFE